MIHHFLLVTSSPSASLSTVTLNLSHIKKENSLSFSDSHLKSRPVFSKRLYTTFSPGPSGWGFIDILDFWQMLRPGLRGMDGL